MKKCLLLVALLFVIVSFAQAQIRPYQNQHRTYVPGLDLNFIASVYDELEQRLLQNKAEAEMQLNDFSYSAMELLSQDIDEHFRAILTACVNHCHKLNQNIDCQNAEDTKKEVKRLKTIVDDSIIKYYNNSSKNEGKHNLPQVWSGTGFALDDGYIVTNYHIVDGAKTISVFGVNGNNEQIYNASVVVSDKEKDISVLQITDSLFNGYDEIPYSVSLAMANVGDEIFVLGYPLTSTMGEEIKYTTGVISAKTGFQGDVSLYQISAPIQPGNSGGPLFDTLGNVVGIVNAKHNDAENVGYAIKMPYLKIMVDSYASDNILPNKNSMGTLSRSEQIKILQNFVFLIKCSNTENKSLVPSSETSQAETNMGVRPTSINYQSKVMRIAESFQLKLLPEEANSFIVKYESDDPDIAYVTSDGIVVAMNIGATDVCVHCNGEVKKCNGSIVRN